MRLKDQDGLADIGAGCICSDLSVSIYRIFKVHLNHSRAGTQRKILLFKTGAYLLHALFTGSIIFAFA